jgi:hypothetical protein
VTAKKILFIKNHGKKLGEKSPKIADVITFHSSLLGWKTNIFQKLGHN